MSVIMILRTAGDPAALEQYANAHADQLNRIAGVARATGAKSHVFAAGDGEVVVIDEWDSEEKFQAFFGSQKEIADVMAGAGATGAPQISFYRKLNTPDAF
jgi:heme-degrading monooxygenase HmoA